MTCVGRSATVVANKRGTKNPNWIESSGMEPNRLQRIRRNEPSWNESSAMEPNRLQRNRRNEPNWNGTEQIATEWNGRNEPNWTESDEIKRIQPQLNEINLYLVRTK